MRLSKIMFALKKWDGHARISLAQILLLTPALASAQQLLPSPSPERCVGAAANTRTAAEWLDRAARTVLPSSTVGKVLRYRASHDQPLWEQSDRMYEPFIPNAQVTQRWFDPATGVEGRQSIERPLSGRQVPAQLYTETSVFLGRDTMVTPAGPVAALLAPLPRLNPWLILLAWRAHADEAHVTQRCLYRDAWRIVLTRGGERLFLSESDATPTKLERIEPHYLWGQVKAEYLWSTWWGTVGGGMYPNAAFLLYDGTIYQRVGVSGFSTALIPSDSAPRMTVPSIAVGRPADAVPDALTGPSTATRPDTIRVTNRTFLLKTPAYTQTVTLQRDTVFLFDATTSEARARQDSAWVATLFPGKHPVVLVVTDLAWPHISGVRFWVARGATVVSHRASESFLRRVVDRRWTLHPDALEKARATSRLKFRAVDDSLRLANGAVTVYALQNTSTETALGVWVGGDRFFWAGDYVQGGISPYARDVAATIRALRLTPDKVGAQHVPLTNWKDLDARLPTVQP